MESGGGKAAKLLRKLLGRDGARIVQRATGEEFGKQRSAGNGSRAAAAEKARFSDASVFKSRRKFEHIAANGIAELDCGRGVRERASIAWIAKMVENCIAEHRKKYDNAGEKLQRGQANNIGRLSSPRSHSANIEGEILRFAPFEAQGKQDDTWSLFLLRQALRRGYFLGGRYFFSMLATTT